MVHSRARGATERGSVALRCWAMGRHSGRGAGAKALRAAGTHERIGVAAQPVRTCASTCGIATHEEARLGAALYGLVRQLERQQ
eukprot:2530006-Prymnesium_polylepis.1